MQRFFSSLSSLEAFTHSLNTLTRDNSCKHCSKNDQWVSHGFVRKVRYGRTIAIIGKRMFCSNRNNKQGCGRTHQLYLSRYIPNMHYSALQLAIFISQLLAGYPVEEAYCKAVGNCEARQAWRWVNRLAAKMGSFRNRVGSLFSLPAQRIHSRSRRLTLLLEPLQQRLYRDCDLSEYQTTYQETFM